MVVDFENAVAAMSDADIVEVPVYSRRAHMASVARGRRTATVTAPRSKYDVCLLVAMAPYWVPGLRYIRDLRSIARRVIVYLFDAWMADLSLIRSQRRVWSEVDFVFVSFPHVVDAYQAALRGTVLYLPQAIEPRWYHPYRRERPIDILSVGRRVSTVHAHLLDASRRRDLFYYYQTHYRPVAIDPCEAQELLGRLYQSARVQVHWAVEHTSADRVNEGAAVTARWFEAAASGGAVVGRAPATAEFADLFPYPGFVRDLSPDAMPREVDEVVDEALSDTRYAERRELAEHVRSVHTWDARWREIVAAAGV
jgi:hypothetical protein